MRPDQKTAQEVLATIEDYVQSLNRRELYSVMDCFADDMDCVHIGMWNDKWFAGKRELRASFERTLSQAEDIRFDYWNVQLMGNRLFCWMAADLSVKERVGGRERTYCGHATAVLQRRGMRWQFVQSHFLLPDVMEAEGGADAEAEEEALPMAA